MRSNSKTLVFITKYLSIQLRSPMVELHSVTLLFDVSQPRTIPFLSKIPEIKKYAVITFINHRIVAVNTKPIYRMNIKKKSMQFGNSTMQFGNYTSKHLLKCSGPDRFADVK